MEGFFIPDGTEEDLQFFKTKDEEYSLTVRPDGFFVLHKLNHKDDAYDWVETYFHSFEECEKYMKKQGYKPSLTIQKALIEFISDGIEHLSQPLNDKQMISVFEKAWSWLQTKEPGLSIEDNYNKIEAREGFIEELNTHIRESIIHITK